MSCRLWLCALLLACPAWAGSPAEQRWQTLAAELRCPSCQNQSLLDSDSALARDIRRQALRRLAAGDSEAQVVDYLRQRYGDYISYRPPFDQRTVLLWVGPVLLLAAGAWALRWHLQQGET